MAYSESIKANDWTGALTALQNSAGVSGYLFQYRAAMEKYLRAKPIAKQLDDKELQAMIAGNTAALYLQMGEADLAGAEAFEALRLLLPSGLPPAARAGLLGNAAEARAAQRRLDEALPLFHQAIDAAGEQSDLSAETKILDHLGDALRQAGRLDEAESAFTESYRLRLMAQSPLLPVSWSRLGCLRLDQGRTAEAERFLSMALDRSRAFGSSVPRWRMLLARGRAREAENKLELALEDFRAARADIRRWRLEVVPADAVRVTANAGLSELYEEYAVLAGRMYAKTGSTALLEESLLAIEENRGASFRESVAGSPRRLPQEYWDTLAKLRSTAAGPDGSRAVALGLRLIELEIQAGLPTAPPEGADYTLRSIQRRLGVDECLIGFVLSKCASFRWSLTRDRAFLHQLPARSEISRAVAAFRSAVRDAGPEAPSIGARLHDMLLGSVPPVCRKKSVWKLALDDELFEAPLAALRTEGRYLIELHRLEIVPSALATSPANGFSRRFAGFADPIYNRADERFPKYARASGTELSRIPASKAEVESGSRAWAAAGLPKSVSLGALVTRDRVSEEVQERPAVLHLAMHVVPSPAEPGGLALAFGLNRAGQMETMSARDTCQYRSDIGLVTLSGCASGAGPVRDGAGLMGLTRAWLLAGARSVVASYWPVPDEEGRLFKTFYAELASELALHGRFCPAAALQKSQLMMLRAGGFHAEPRHWAAYFTVSRGLPE